MRVPLSIATGDYDITRPILDGAVTVDGVDLIPMKMASPERHWRTLVNHEFDIAELSLGSFVAQAGRDYCEFVAVPAFPHRRFRHGYVIVTGKSDARSADELAGTAIGVRSWQTTAGIWLRGILAEHHGLATESVRWVAQDAEDVPLALPPGIRLESAPAGRTVTEMCAAGDLAGLVYPEIPAQVRDGSGAIRRLFESPKKIEQEYFAQTGIFPIMHVVVIRAELVERYPWLPRAVLDLFTKAKDLARDRLRDPRTVSLAWLRALQEEEKALLGPDPWNYGYNPTNVHTLATFLEYACQQGVVARRLDPRELFHPTTLADVPRYT